MNKKILVVLGTVLTIVASPVVAHAQGFDKLITDFSGIIQNLVPLVMGLALLVFLWGVLSYALSKEDGGKEAAKGYMLWGLIALFVMVSVWGLVKILQETVGIKEGSATLPKSDLPKVPVE